MKNKPNKILAIIGCILLVGLVVFLFFYINHIKAEGEYDYCVEWIGLNNGTLYRDNLLYTCYNLATQTFFCDYEVMKDNKLLIKPIINITKNNEGVITEIVYDEANIFNCKKWLKSRGVN